MLTRAKDTTTFGANGGSITTDVERFDKLKPGGPLSTFCLLWAQVALALEREGDTGVVKVDC